MPAPGRYRARPGGRARDLAAPGALPQRHATRYAAGVMKPPDRPLQVAIIATPEATAASLFGVFDVLCSVGRDWEILHGRPAGPTVFEPRIVTADGSACRCVNGIVVQAHAALAAVPAPDIVLVPDLHLDPANPLPASYAPFARWITSAYDAGALVASVCSGAVVIAATGLLDGGEATTHWAYCEALARRHPEIRVRKERVLVPTGAGHRLITAGGASSAHDLLLYLIGRYAGAEEARRIAKLYLLHWHSDGQLPFAALTVGRSDEDKVVAAAQAFLADHYADPHPVADIALRSGLPERTLLRRFRAATGMAPRDYVCAVRIEEAKQMLETTPLPVDAVGEAVGYAEPASFRSAFRKRVGLSPSAYRRRYSGPGLREAGGRDAVRA